MSYHKAYYQANREKKLAYQKTYTESHKDKVLEYRKAYRDARPAETRGRVARSRGSLYADLTTDQWNNVLASFNYCCAYCGRKPLKPLQIDHITPTIDGGAHTLHNVVPACHQCNCKKRQGGPLKPVQPLLL